MDHTIDHLGGLRTVGMMGVVLEISRYAFRVLVIMVSHHCPRRLTMVHTINHMRTAGLMKVVVVISSA
jgi:hypothetical protein